MLKVLNEGVKTNLRLGLGSKFGSENENTKTTRKKKKTKDKTSAR